MMRSTGPIHRPLDSPLINTSVPFGPSRLHRHGQVPGRRSPGARRPACATRPGTARRWRSTNLLERSFGEVKRRTKVIGRFPGETSCLSLGR
jgi:hypothetical protein